MRLLGQTIKIFVSVILLFCANLVWVQADIPVFSIYASDHSSFVLSCSDQYKPDPNDCVDNESSDHYTLTNSKGIDFQIISVNNKSEDGYYSIEFKTTENLVAGESLTLSGEIWLTLTNELGTKTPHMSVSLSESFVPLFVPSRPTRTGTPYAWGNSSATACGTAALNTDGLTNIVAVAATVKGSVYLKSDGTVVFRGSDSFTGIESWEDVVQIAASVGVVAGLKSDGSVYISTLDTWDNIVNGKILGWSNIVQIDCSEDRVVGLGTDGKIKLFSYSEAGIGEDINFLTIPNIVDVAASKNTVFVKDSNNRLHKKANTSTFSLETIPNVSLLSAGYNRGVCVTGTTLLNLLDDTYSFTDVSSGESITAANVTKIDSGRIHNLFLLKDGTIQANGNSSAVYAKTSELEKLTSNDHIIDIAAGSYHSIVLKTNPITETSSVAESGIWTWVPDLSKLPWNNVIFSLGENLPDGMEFHSETGVLTWELSQNEIAPDDYTFTIIAASANDPEQTVEIEFTITVQNAAPVFANLPKTWQVNPKEENSLYIIATDSSSVGYSISDNPDGMDIDATTGKLSWNPPLSAAGQSYTISITASDGELSTTKQLTVTVSSVSLPPEIITVPTESSAQLTVGTLWSFQLIATDADTATASLTWGFSSGKDIPTGLTVTKAGLLSWTPSNSLCGDHEIWVTVSDGTNSDETSFYLFVNKTNHTPVWSTIPDQSVKTGEKFTLDLSDYASDADSDTLGYTVSGAPEDADFDQSTGILFWGCTKQNTKTTHSYSITVTASDGLLEASKTFNLTATYENKNPVISGNKTSVSINECESSNITSLLGWTFSDPDNDTPLSYTLQNAPTGMSVDNSGTITWTPTEAQGPSTNTVTLVVKDADTVQQGTITKNFTVIVNEVNKAPVLAAISTQSVKVGETFTYQLSATDEDIPANTLTYRLVSGYPTGMTIDPATGNISWECTKASLPTGTQNYQIEIKVSDGLLEASKTFTLKATYDNKNPVITGTKTSVTIDECESFNITSLLGWTFSDPDGDTLSFDLENEPEGMSVDNSGTITWTPSEEQGPETYSNITLKVTDADTIQPGTDSKNFTVSVNEVNKAPVLAAISAQSVKVGETFTYQLSATDEDIPANTLTYSLVSGYPTGMTIDPATGNISWECTKQNTPAATSHTITVRVSDGTLASSKTFTLTATYDNKAPVISGTKTSVTINECESSNITTLLGWRFSDPDGDTLSFDLENEPEGMSIVINTGEITWTPTEAQGPSTNTVTLVVKDSDTVQQGSITKDFTVIVREVNTAPVFGSIPQINAEVGILSYIETIRATDSDLPAQTLTYETETTLAGFTLLKNGDILYLPVASDIGIHTITITCKDNGTPQLTATKQVTISVKKHIELFHFLPISNITIKEHENFYLQLTAIGGEGTGTINYTFSSTPPTGMSLSASGLLFWCPSETDGDKSFPVTVQATKGNETASTTFYITVDEVNDAPIITNPSQRYTISENVLLAKEIDANDPEGKPLSYTVTSVTPSLSNSSNQPYFDGNVLKWQTTEADGSDKTDGSNIYTIIVKVSDPENLFATATIVVKVKEANQNPIITTDSDLVAYQGELFSQIIEAIDNDIPAQKISFKLLPRENTALPEGLSIHPYTGTLLWRVKLSTELGIYPFIIMVTDENGGSTSKNFNITVGPWSDSIKGSSVDLLEVIKEGENFEFNLGESAKDFKDWFLATGPETALYTPENGILAWTPSELDGGEKFTITLRNKNQNTEKLNVISLNIEVLEVNDAPDIHFEPIQAVYPEQEIRIFIYATDSDIPEQEVILSFVSELPQGASFDSETGEFVWRPTAKQLENIHHLLLEASDSEGLSVQKELVIPSYQLSESDVEVLYSYNDLGNVELTWTLSESTPSESFDIYGISSQQQGTWQKIACIQVDENTIILSTSTWLNDMQFFSIRDALGNLCPTRLQNIDSFIQLSLEMENEKIPYTCYTAEFLPLKEVDKIWRKWITVNPSTKSFSYNAKISESVDGFRSYRVVRSQK